MSLGMVEVVKDWRSCGRRVGAIRLAKVVGGSFDFWRWMMGSRLEKKEGPASLLSFPFENCSIVGRGGVGKRGGVK